MRASSSTLRPETVYGVTNLWLNPNAEYVRVPVANETWILSASAAEKPPHSTTLRNSLSRRISKSLTWASGSGRRLLICLVGLELKIRRVLFYRLYSRGTLAGN